MSAACGKTTIWGRRSSFNVQKVLWLADELGLDYEHVPAGGQFGQLDTPAFLAMNPHGKVHPPLPHVRAWYDQLQARPAYRQHVMVPFGELRGRLEF